MSNDICYLAKKFGPNHLKQMVKGFLKIMDSNPGALNPGNTKGSGLCSISYHPNSSIKPGLREAIDALEAIS